MYFSDLEGWKSSLSLESVMEMPEVKALMKNKEVVK